MSEEKKVGKEIRKLCIKYSVTSVASAFDADSALHYDTNNGVFAIYDDNGICFALVIKKNRKCYEQLSNLVREHNKILEFGASVPNRF